MTEQITSEQRFIAAATDLLDAGGESAVTLRAVAAAVGLSHNAPYKRFGSRDALLAAVATREFRAIGEEFERVRRTTSAPLDRLRAALEVVIRYSEEHPGRYRLLLSNPIVASQEGALQEAANDTIVVFDGLVEACQEAGSLPRVSNSALSGIVFSAVLGLIDAQASGRLQAKEGLVDVRSSTDLLIQLLTPNQASPG